MNEKERVSQGSVLRSLMGISCDVDWTDQDRANLRIFLNSQTGQRFVHKFRNAVQMATQIALLPNKEKAEARGWNAAYGWLVRLTAIDPLKLVKPNGQVSLTEDKVETSESEGQEEAALIGTEGLGFPIGHQIDPNV